MLNNQKTSNLKQAKDEIEKAQINLLEKLFQNRTSVFVNTKDLLFEKKTIILSRQKIN